MSEQNKINYHHLIWRSMVVFLDYTLIKSSFRQHLKARLLKTVHWDTKIQQSNCFFFLKKSYVAFTLHQEPDIELAILEWAKCVSLHSTFLLKQILRTKCQEHHHNLQNAEGPKAQANAKMPRRNIGPQKDSKIYQERT